MKRFDEQDEELAAALRALGHPVRLSILRFLVARGASNCCCTDVTESLPLAQSTVSQHIKVLLDAGLIQRQSQGTRNCYCVCAEKLAAIASTFDNYVGGLTPLDSTKERDLTESV